MTNSTVNIFQMKSKPHGNERFNDFIGIPGGEPSFVAIGWPGLGDLTNVSKDEIRQRLEEVYDYQGQQLATYLGAVNAFVNTVKEGDLILITNNHDQVYVYEVGEYRYVKKYDNDIDGMCHQRKAKLLKVLNKAEINQELQELLRNRGTITQFKYTYEKSGLHKYLANEKSDQVYIDELVRKSLSVLEMELESDDSMNRIKAASEILKYINESK